MATKQKEKHAPKVLEDPEKIGDPPEISDDGAEAGEDDGAGRTSEPSADGESAALAVAGGETASIEAAGAEVAVAERAAGPEAPDDADAGDLATGTLGTDRYVLAGFFASGMLVAYILGRIVHSTWATLSNKDWFSRTFPTLAAVADDDKSTYATVLGAVIALVAVLRVYRRPDVRAWSDEVAAELAKVKWPTRKEVGSSTIVVITASTVATLYLALLDRFWAFVTNLVYGGNGT